MTTRLQPNSTLIRRSLIGVSIAGLMVLGSWLTTAKSFAAPLSACGTITTSVVLQNDLSSSTGVCIKIGADGITVDGNGHTITVSGSTDNWAVYNTHYAHVTVQNIVTGQGVYVYGPSAAETIQHSTIGAIAVAGADDTVIDHNTLGVLAVYGNSGDAALRTHVTNNTISSSAHTIVSMLGDGLAACPATDYLIADNTITSSYACGGAGQPACDEPKVMFLRCGTGNVVTRNVVHSLVSAMPLRLRDGFDSSTVSDNTFWASSDVPGAFATLNITSGSNPQHFPQNNTFARNVFRADHDEAFFIETSGPNNTFSHNVFWANAAYVGHMGADTNANNLFDHNTFYNAGTGTAVHFTYRSPNVNTFTNNIFSYQGAAVYSYDGCDNTQYAGDHNLFSNRAGSVSFASYASTLAAWKALPSVAPDDAASIEGDPKFTDAAAGIFSLQAGSPALGTASDGTNIGAWQSAASCTEQWSCGDWSACSGGTQTRSCIDSHMCGTTTVQPASTRACSQNPGPTVRINYPTGKKTIGGVYGVQVSATDPDGVARLNFFIDGQQFGTDIRTPYRATLDTRSLRNGQHTLAVVGLDKKGNTQTVTRLIQTKNTFVVRLSTPWLRLRVAGIVTLQPRLIYGGSALVRAEYFIDRKLALTSTTSQFDARWDTRSLKNGSHRVTIRMTDALGKQTTHTVYLTVRN